MKSKHGTMRKTKKSQYMVLFKDRRGGLCYRRFFQDFDDLADYMADMEEAGIELIECVNIRYAL